MSEAGSSERGLARLLIAVETVAVSLVLLGMLATLVSDRGATGVATRLIHVGTVCLLGAPVLALARQVIRFAADRPLTAWYAAATIAVAGLGVLLAA